MLGIRPIADHTFARGTCLRPTKYDEILPIAEDRDVPAAPQESRNERCRRPDTVAKGLQTLYQMHARLLDNPSGVLGYLAGDAVDASIFFWGYNGDEGPHVFQATEAITIEYRNSEKLKTRS